MRPILEIKDMKVTLNSSTLVKGIDLQLHEGETVGIIGESGSCKSTTANAITRLLPHKSRVEGEIIFNGVPLQKLKEEEMRSIRGKEIGMIFQDPVASLNPTMRIGEQIGESARLHLGLSKKEARLHAISLLDKVGINAPETRCDLYPHQLSGGMRQRVIIAMAISCNPKILIADEPTSALDVTVQAQILKLLKTIQKEKGLAILLITHDLDIVYEFCDRAHIMRNGEIVESALVNDLFLKPAHPYTRELLQYV